jgi:hypothetical protein
VNPARRQLASASRHRPKLDALLPDDEGEDRLRAFFESCWNVKDHARSGLPASAHPAFEAAVNAERTLRIVADVANRSKHVHLTRNDRCGAHVSTKQIYAFDGSSDVAVARYRITLADGPDFDALEVADRALEAWERVLCQFAL